MDALHTGCRQFYADDIIVCEVQLNLACKNSLFRAVSFIPLLDGLDGQKIYQI